MEFAPLQEIVPKHETLASQFLQRYPQFDGRNTIVAIFDTGVDPGALGLQVTSDGKPKVIDVVDATGSSDVDMSLVVKAKDNKLELPDGKTIKLNPEWKATDNEYRVGVKRAYELYPQLLVTRMKKERKEKWDAKDREATNEVQRLLAEWTAKHQTPTAEDIVIRKELKARLEHLKDCQTNYDDPGPIYTCVVFHDGTHYQAALTNSEQNEFTKVSSMTNYRIKHEYAKFSEMSQLNYVLNIYEEGKVLSVVCDAGAHGTHVAGIVAAYHSDDTKNNGVAPGAQIVSVKIGDTRLGSMETVLGVSRGVLAVLENKCNIVNMSYGEFASSHDSGRFIELVKDLVNKHNVTFVSSAGNEGPALGTVGAPGGTSSCILGVGAYVSPEMMSSEYSMPIKTNGMPYTWSSRGPSFDGDLGVNVSAPGGAITCVPNWTLNKKQLMNGTSMSSPNCAGNIALLISGLKQSNIQYHPYSIRRALENTAEKLQNSEDFAQGCGLIQVLPAFQLLQSDASNTFDGSLQQPMYYDVLVLNALSKQRGIYLREKNDFNSNEKELNVQLTPFFHKHTENKFKVQFELQLKLVPTMPWIICADNVTLLHEGRTVKCIVRTSTLPAGHHYGEILGYNAENESFGPVVRIPVTVIKPETLPIANLSAPIVSQLQMNAGTIIRKFYTTPIGSTWVNVSVKRFNTNTNSNNTNENSILYALHLMQYEKYERQSATSLDKVFRLDATGESTFSFGVIPQSNIEICFAQYWNSIGQSNVEVEIDFHGITPDEKSVHINGGEGIGKVNLYCGLRSENIQPEAKLTKYIQRKRPDSFVISPLSSSRDLYPDQKQMYQLVLTYSFSKTEAGKITPRLPYLNNRLYESPFESQLCMVFDQNKKYLGTSDAYPREIAVKKGNFTIRTQIRHQDPAVLESLKNMIMYIEHSIKEIAVPVYDNPDDASLQGSKSMTAKAIPQNVYYPVYVGEPSFESLPKDIQQGDLLSGKITYGKKNTNYKGSSQKPEGYNLSYSAPATEPKTKEPEAKDTQADAKTEVYVQFSSVYRIQLDNYLQAGDYIFNNGSNGQSAFSNSTFNDENFILKHTGPGVLSMVNSGPDSNTSQFRIFFKAASEFDNKHVVFGALLGGKSFENLQFLESLGSDFGLPQCSVIISNCGQLFP